MPTKLTPVSTICCLIVILGAFAWSLWGGGYAAAWLAPAVLVPVAVGVLVGFGGARADRFSWVTLAALGLVGVFLAWELVALRWASWNEALIEDFNRIGIYAAILVLGIVAGRSRRAVQVTVAALVVTCGLAAAVNLWWLADGHLGVMSNNRLRGMIGYYNGQAAYLLLGLFPGLVIASGSWSKWWLRAVALASCTLIVPVALATQSRGAVVAAVGAALCAFIVAPERLRLLLATLVAAPCVWATWPAVTRLIAAGRADEGVASAAGELLRTSLVAAGVAALVAIVWSAVDARVELPKRASRIVGATVLSAVVATAGAGAVVAASNADALRAKLDDRIESLSEGDGGGESQTTEVRLGSLTTGTAAARVEQWQVAWQVTKDNHLTGVGPGNWEPLFYQLRDRRLDSYLRQPHSLAMEMSAERGAVGSFAALGVILLVVWMGLRGAFARGRRVENRALAAGMLVAGVYWFAHAQVDWLLQIPSATAPVALMAGLLLGQPWRPIRKRAAHAAVRTAIAVALVAVGCAAVPNFVANELVKVSRAAQPVDQAEGVAAAYAAGRWAPWSTHALREQARWHEAAGEIEEAAGRLQEVIDRNPEHYASYQLMAELYQRAECFDEALPWWEAAIERNPLNVELTHQRNQAEAALIDEDQSDDAGASGGNALPDT